MKGKLKISVLKSNSLITETTNSEKIKGGTGTESLPGN